MPELKHNFIKGRMNLDLDERLVSDGEYRKAMNIEVSTSEGSSVGTVQSVLGNGMPSTIVAPAGGHVVGSIADTKTDKIYYLVQTLDKDLIVEHSAGSDVPVLVDVYNVKHIVTQDTVNAITSFADTSIIVANNVETKNIRKNMFLEATMSVTFLGNPLLITLSEEEGTIVNTATGVLVNNFGPVFVKGVQGVPPINATTREIFLQTQSGEPFPAGLIASQVGNEITFKSKRILNFTENNFITGINIIDDMMFWTDNISEPKKISIQRSKDGIWSGWDGHSRFIVYNSDNVQVSNRPMEEKHATVVKMSPLTPPSLEMYNSVDARGVVFGVTDSINFSEQIINNNAAPPDIQIQVFPAGTLVDIPGNFGINPGDPEFLEGDILLLSSDSDLVANPRIFTDYEIRVVVVGSTNTTLSVKILSFKKSFFPFSIDANGLPDQDWAICLEQAKALFEFKFPRFAYRYKYQDNEYSCFSPFSEVAFMPGTFGYDSKNAYNLGMVNQLRFLKILDFVPDGIPKGVIEVDILYKESNSPNIYTVKTVKYGDPEWNAFGHTTPQSPWTGNTKGAIQLESEVIYASVPSNQLLRPWDNVPRKARAQELSASRIIYGNYVEGYDMTAVNNINIETFIKSRDLSNMSLLELDSEPAYIGGKSIKSLRTYQVGIVYKDEFGRETPVFTNEAASFNIAKSLADDYSSLFVQNKSIVPSWVDSYKFFIKETSNEYYNVALDRWYDARDGGVWLSFPSAERNKIDEETYLILKKQHDNSNFVEEEARYKVIAIENEAPDYIKLQRTSLNTQACASNTIIAATTNVTATTSTIDGVTRGKSGLVIRLFNANASTGWYPIKSVNEQGGSDIVTLNGTFEVDVTAEIMGGVTSGVSWEVAEEVFHNKPEFQGRFFVKIAEDGVLLSNIDTAPATSDTFTVNQSAKQYYMKSNFKDNSWCQAEQWGKGSEPGSWRKVIGQGFFIDHISRNWGGIPGGPGPWSEDSGKGISGSRTGVRKNHIELSLSGIEDSTEEGFSISSHNKPQRDFYNSLHTQGKWLRWKEDPNGVIYKIQSSIGQGDSGYGHGSGIYNYDGGNGTERTWRSNKTRRLYIKLQATGWRKDASGAYFEDVGIRNLPPTWVSGGLSAADADSNIAAWVTTTWDPTKTAAGASIKQASNDFDVGNMSDPISSGTGVDDQKFNTIEFVQKYDADAIKEMSENPAIFETEPKEDVGLDIYYEADQAFPTKINHETNENFAQLGSTIQTDYIDSFIQTWTDVGTNNGWTADFTNSSNQITLNNPNLHRHDLLGAFISSDGLALQPSVPNALNTYFNPLDPQPVVIDIDNDTITLSQDAIATAAGIPIVFTRVKLPKIKYWSDNIATLDCKVINPQTQTGLGYYADNVALPIGMGTDFNSLVFNRLSGGTISGGIFDDINNPAQSSEFNGVTLHNGFLQLTLRRDSSRAKIDLTWSNCYSFGNGVESDRVRDDYNAVRVGKGVKASTTFSQKYKQDRKKHSLIYSGVFNDASGVNNTNQFIMAEKITKDLNPRHGSIQKLHAREGDLITLCEDKVFKILSNKDALFNADGNPQMIATNRVLGQATPMGGEYGISTNPESFASQAYKSYFSDKARGVILKLDSQGLIPISDHGMKDYFADNLPISNNVVGSYDNKKDTYNVTLTGLPTDDYGFKFATISFGERTNGWTSFKSFSQEGGVSLNNNYYTFKDGNMWRHHQGTTAVFYGERKNPTIDVLFNQLPSSVKSFGSLNYEGSQSRVTQNVGDGEYNNNLAAAGWYVSRGNTDLQQTDVLEFKNKENKWFSRMKGEAYNVDNIDLSEFSFQGIDMASSILEDRDPAIDGCMDPAALNFDPLATRSDDSCCYDYGCTDSQIGFYPTTNGLDRFGNLCIFPCQDSTGGPIGFAADDFNPKFDCCPPDVPCCNYPNQVYGCTDVLASNYDATANFDDGTCCYAGCMDPLANNYNPNACVGDGSCIYNQPCTQGTVNGEAGFGIGMYPNITQNNAPGGMWISQSNQAVIRTSLLNTNNITVGCQISNTYLPNGTTIVSIIPYNALDSYVYLSNTFNNAPTPLGQVHNYGAASIIPSQSQVDYLNFDFSCGTCDTYNLKVSDIGDADTLGAANSYTVTEHELGNFQVGASLPNVAYLQIHANSNSVVRAADFSISGGLPSSILPPTFVGGSLPPEIEFVKFENQDNQIFQDYTDPNGADPNPNYDPNFIPTVSNVVLVIISLHVLSMPSNDLDLLIDIDGSASSSNIVVNDITLM